MSGALQAVYRNLRSFGAAPGSLTYTGIGNTQTFVAPAGVTSVSVVAVGAGGIQGAGGLGYKNNISVVPGNSYTLRTGRGNAGGCTIDSYFISVCVVRGGSGTGANAGGTYTGDGGGNGGAGGAGGGAPGGAGGYSGAGGKGGAYGGAVCSCNFASGLDGSGGGGGGGGFVYSRYPACGYCCTYVGGGGGVGLCGQGTSGTGGPGGQGGGGGSGGTAGGTPTPCVKGVPGVHGGGGRSIYANSWNPGAVRVVWPGNTRQFPSTCVGSP